LIVIAWRKAQYFSDLALIKLSVTPLSGAYLSPSDMSKKTYQISGADFAFAFLALRTGVGAPELPESSGHG
jgi:hypothetical protein